MKSELRFTDTNAASDSKGRTWGLEGGLFWWLVGGAIVRAHLERALAHITDTAAPRRHCY